ERRSPAGRRPWPTPAARPSWSAANATTASTTGTPQHRSRSNRRRAGYPETGTSGSEGGRAEKDQPRLAPRRSADPTQTLKNGLTAKPPQPATLADLQALLDAFTSYYNHQRPHKSLPHHATPAVAYTTRPKAAPGNRTADTHDRIRTDRIWGV